jgi:hypothetical protein
MRRDAPDRVQVVDREPGEHQSRSATSSRM